MTSAVSVAVAAPVADHDHFSNGKILADALNRSDGYTTSLPCTVGDAAKGEACEEAFTQLDDVDVLVIIADTYENPLRGSLSAEQWDGLFSFVEGGGGLFALHTASACWMDWCNQTECLNSHTNCGANETTKVCP